MIFKADRDFDDVCHKNMCIKIKTTKHIIRYIVKMKMNPNFHKKNLSAVGRIKIASDLDKRSYLI